MYFYCWITIFLNKIHEKEIRMILIFIEFMILNHYSKAFKYVFHLSITFTLAVIRVITNADDESFLELFAFYMNDEFMSPNKIGMLLD